MEGTPQWSSNGNLLESVSNYFNMSNIDLKDLNITADHLKYFIEFYVDKHKSSLGNEKPNFPVDLLKQFDSAQHGFNRSTKGFDDVTVNHINFISNIYTPTTSWAGAVDCDGYCGGMLRETLLEYKAVHGYIALVVG